MKFELTTTQQSLRNDVREFAEREIEPRAIELDRQEVYPSEILDELGERRLTGLTLPEAYGGRGEGLVELALMIEELSAALMSVASTVGLHLGVATVVERFGTEDQRDEFLPEMATFDIVGALGLSEANAGSNKLEMETTAERDGTEWVLDGHKQWVTNFLDADYVLTYAKTGSDEDAPQTSARSSFRPGSSRSGRCGRRWVRTASSPPASPSTASAFPRTGSSVTKTRGTFSAERFTPA